MATISGRMTLTCEDLAEYTQLLDQVAGAPDFFALVVKDDPSITFTIDVTNAPS